MIDVIGYSHGPFEMSTKEKLATLSKLLFIPLTTVVLWTVMIVKVESVLLQIAFSMALGLTSAWWAAMLLLYLINHLNGTLDHQMRARHIQVSRRL